MLFVLQCPSGEPPNRNDAVAIPTIRRIFRAELEQRLGDVEPAQKAIAGVQPSWEPF